MAPGDQTARRCYAEQLGGCEGALSREHYVTHKILKVLDADGEMGVTGLPLRGVPEGKKVSPSSLTAKVLCKKHNSDLSPVDDAFADFLLAFSKFHNDLMDNKVTSDAAITIDGTLVERWLLKFACGLISSGNAGIGVDTVNKTPPPPGLLRMLFGHDPLPAKWGLYALAPNAKESDPQGDFSLAPTFEEQGGDMAHLGGVQLSHYGFVSFLKLKDPLWPIPGLDLSRAIYRPGVYELRRPATGRKATISLQWPTDRSKEGFRVVLAAPGDPAPSPADLNPAGGG